MAILQTPMRVLAAWSVLLLGHWVQAAEPLLLTGRLHHLRSGEQREWSEFPEQSEAKQLELRFQGTAAAGEQTLILRQQDVKQGWLVRLNGQDLARLPTDENDMVVYFQVPAGRIVAGENVLRIEPAVGGKLSDDIRIGEISLDPRPREKVLGEATVEIEVRDAESNEFLPARITLIHRDGALQSVGAASNEHLAVRPGTVYTGNGQARFGLPAGRYQVYAGRGFEYSLAEASIEAVSGETLRRTLRIRREVPTEGYVVCDTHIHTLTHSGHGDATAQERMITLAAEGIELPIATDHNRHVDYEPLAREMGLRRYFTPVIGNEVTTSVGHFNVFPVRADSQPPDFRARDWQTIFASIYQTPNVKVVILNHPRDVHSGVRPFGPKLHNALVGDNVQGWQLRSNAMEVINSGAVQSDPLQLFRDWMGMLNGGSLLTPVGASDSHDVARHFVGQGRTYVRARDDDAAAIDIDEAVDNFLQGRVMVSYGLLAELTIDAKSGPGELAPVAGDTIAVAVRVLGPHWIRASQVDLYANGHAIRTAKIPADSSPHRSGALWTGVWKIPRPMHDVHLVAIAQGPGVEGLYWKTAKPYQPTSPEFRPLVIGASGAVWIDVDGDGRRTPACDYARRLVAEGGDNLSALLASLGSYDEAVAAQAAYFWQKAGRSLLDEDAQAALQHADPQVLRGVRAAMAAWRENQLARDAAP